MKNHYEPVKVNASMEDIMKRASRQNFVPVVDDSDHFIGMIRRKELINYLYEHSDIKDALLEAVKKVIWVRCFSRTIRTEKRRSM